MWATSPSSSELKQQKRIMRARVTPAPFFLPRAYFKVPELTWKKRHPLPPLAKGGRGDFIFSNWKFPSIALFRGLLRGKSISGARFFSSFIFHQLKRRDSAIEMPRSLRGMTNGRSPGVDPAKRRMQALRAPHQPLDAFPRTPHTDYHGSKGTRKPDSPAPEEDFGWHRAWPPGLAIPSRRPFPSAAGGCTSAALRR